MENSIETNEVSTLKPEHLAGSSKPIIACVGTPEDFGEEENTLDQHFKSSGSKADYWQARNEGKGHTVSEVDDRDKYSTGYTTCTGIIATGIDKQTGKNISLLTHQDVDSVLSSPSFLSDLNLRLQELKNKSITGTIDAVIVGGGYSQKDAVYDDGRDEYVKVIKLLSENIVNNIGFKPHVITGPKTESVMVLPDRIYYDNDKRRAYILRPKIGASTVGYSPDKIDDERTKW